MEERQEDIDGVKAIGTSLTIRRILKVNHAGECGAIRIYQAQSFVAKHLYPDLSAWLDALMADEISHRQQFQQAMAERRSKPCHALWLWGLGGYALGLITALAGRNVIMVCTKAVESTVHSHLTDQIAYLEHKDEALRALIIAIRVQELEHLQVAEGRIREGRLNHWVDALISFSTEIAIWLSTQGAVSRMVKEIST